MIDGKRNIIRQFLKEYDIGSAQDIHDALKDLLGGIIKEMIEVEMDPHLGYEKLELSGKDDYHKSFLICHCQFNKCKSRSRPKLVSNIIIIYSCTVWLDYLYFPSGKI